MGILTPSVSGLCIVRLTVMVRVNNGFVDGCVFCDSSEIGNALIGRDVLDRLALWRKHEHIAGMSRLLTKRSNDEIRQPLDGETNRLHKVVWQRLQLSGSFVSCSLITECHNKEGQSRSSP